MEALGEDMLEEAADKFLAGECHHLPPVLTGILIAEGNPMVIYGNDTIVSEGNAVDIASEVGKYVVYSLHRRFAVDYPRGVPERGREADLRQCLTGHGHEGGTE